MGQTLAQGLPTSQIQDGGMPIHRHLTVACRVLYADAEKKMKKSFEKRQLSKNKLL